MDRERERKRESGYDLPEQRLCDLNIVVVYHVTIVAGGVRVIYIYLCRKIWAEREREKK